MHIQICLRLEGNPVQELKDMVHQQSHKLKGNILCSPHQQEHQQFPPVYSQQVMDTH